MSTTLTLGPVTLALPLVAREDNEQPVCFISSPTHDDTEIIAIVPNPCVAHLFASAPDLLVAAEAVTTCGLTDLRLDPEQSDALTALRTAIARARGGA